MRVHGQACPQARGQGLLEGHGGEMASVRGDFFKSQLVGAQEHAPKATHTDRSNLGSSDIFRAASRIRSAKERAPDKVDCRGLKYASNEQRGTLLPDHPKPR